MLPIGDENVYRRSIPVVTWGLIALNVLVFLAELAQPDPEAFILRWGAVPAQISSGQGLGMLVTSMFLHAGWGHLFGNMLFLLIFGDNVEDAMGHVGFLLFYLGCGVAAGLAQTFLAPSSTVPAIGASGAISGVLGAYLIWFGSNPVRVLVGLFPMVLPAWLMIGFWFVLQFTNALVSIGETAETGGVAYAAHVGGFVAGLVLALVLRPARRAPPGRQLPRW